MKKIMFALGCLLFCLSISGCGAPQNSAEAIPQNNVQKVTKTWLPDDKYIVATGYMISYLPSSGEAGMLYWADKTSRKIIMNMHSRQPNATVFSQLAFSRNNATEYGIDYDKALMVVYFIPDAKAGDGKQQEK